MSSTDYAFANVKGNLIKSLIYFNKNFYKIKKKIKGISL